MGRNDLCFCGSGKKQKKCHSDILEESIFGKLIKLYRDIDVAIESGAQRDKLPCKKGCNECCRQHFAISTAEFYYIVEMIKETKGIDALNGYVIKAIGQWVEYKEKHPDMAKRYTRNIEGVANEDNINEILLDAFNTPEYLETECVFVGENGGCDIYDYRPAICRVHGCTNLFTLDEMEILLHFQQTGQEYDVRYCSHSSYLEHKEHIADISDLKKDILGLSNHYTSKYDTIITEREYPIMYFMKIIYENRESINTKINEYKNISEQECINRRADRVLARNR